MIAERRKVLNMLYQRKIDVEEAEGLLDALQRTPEEAPEPEVEIITAHPQTQKVLDYARKIALGSSPVLIVGEAGTGKELLARLIHQNSPRRHKPILFANCTLLSEPLLESELFGHERGAFTGAIHSKMGLVERADGGTVFLDAIDEVPIGLQAKLLRFIQRGEFQRVGSTAATRADTRIIAAANRETLLRLQAEVKANRFRRDLFDRLSLMSLEIPPLRERKEEDIPLLADYFLKGYAAQLDRPAPAIGQEAMDALMAYHWPSNVRELSRVMERALLLCDGDTIKIEHLPEALTEV